MLPELMLFGAGQLGVVTLELDQSARHVTVVEVLSPSTEEYDRGLKWAAYRQVASLTDYLLVAQRTVSIEHYRREADGSWRYRALGPGERVQLTNGVELDLDSIFDGVFDLVGE